MQHQDVPPISKNIAETDIDTLTDQYQTFAHVLTSFDLPPLQAKQNLDKAHKRSIRNSIVLESDFESRKSVISIQPMKSYFEHTVPPTRPQQMITSVVSCYDTLFQSNISLKEPREQLALKAIKALQDYYHHDQLGGNDYDVNPPTVIKQVKQTTDNKIIAKKSNKSLLRQVYLKLNKRQNLGTVKCWLQNAQEGFGVKGDLILFTGEQRIIVYELETALSMLKNQTSQKRNFQQQQKKQLLDESVLVGEEEDEAYKQHNNLRKILTSAKQRVKLHRINRINRGRRYSQAEDCNLEEFNSTNLINSPMVTAHRKSLNYLY